MIHSIQGRLKHKAPTEIVVEVGGIAFQISIPVPTFDKLPNIGQEVEVRTYLNVREDALELYGFYTEEELTLFRMLIGITKIGPKLAIGILSGASPEEFKRRIITGDVEALTALPGIGTKTAKRIIIELKEKLVTTDLEDILGLKVSVPDEFDDALAALSALGFTRADGFKVLSGMKRNGEFEGGLEQIVKIALSKM